MHQNQVWNATMIALISRWNMHPQTNDHSSYTNRITFVTYFEGILTPINKYFCHVYKQLTDFTLLLVD